MSTPETRVKNEISFYLSLLRKRGYLDFWWNTSVGIYDQKAGCYRKNRGAYFRNGVSDIIVVLKGGHAAFIEVKAGSNRLSDAQKLFKKSIEAMGATFVEAKSIRDVQLALGPLIEKLSQAKNDQ